MKHAKITKKFIRSYLFLEIKYFKQYKGDSTKPYGPLKPDKNKINGFIFLKVNESFFSKSIRKVNIPK
jgi:hypothetical protein